MITYLLKKNIIFFILLFSSGACKGDTTHLPSELPEDIKIIYVSNSEMSRTRLEIIITADTIKISESTGIIIKDTVTAVISKQEITNLYNVIKLNKFETLKNKESDDIVYDAGEESITVSIVNFYHGASFGLNSPLKNEEQEKQFVNIRAEILKLREDYKNRQN